MNALALINVRLETGNKLYLDFQPQHGGIVSICTDQLPNDVQRSVESFAHKALIRQETYPAEKLECGHPKQALGKVRPHDANEDEHCLWCGDIEDLHTLAGSISKVYMHISDGRISKPMTEPSAVIAVADDLETERVEEAVKEEREEWQEVIRDLIADAEGPEKEMDRHAVVDRLKSLIAASKPDYCTVVADDAMGLAYFDAEMLRERRQFSRVFRNEKEAKDAIARYFLGRGWKIRPVTNTCGKQGCNQPAPHEVWGSLKYHACNGHLEEIEKLTENE